MNLLICSIKIFVPLAVLSFLVLVPVNWTGKTLKHSEHLTFDDVDKLSISNVASGSNR